MKISSRFLCLALVLVAWVFLASNAAAFSSLYTTNCSGCHGAAATCDGCHAHGVHSDATKNNINLTGTTNSTSYAPGETVTVTINGGYRGGWVRTILYDQNMVELARGNGTVPVGGTAPSGGPSFPATLTAPAPPVAGTYTWRVAWYGNMFDAGNAAFGPNWTPDSGNPGHGREMVSTNAFTVVTTPTPAPSITLNPATLNFGAITVGSAATRTSVVSNAGTADLNVTAIALCPGTSQEFTWSPAAPLTAAPGSNVTLSVTYSPVDEGADTGCLNISSNDSANNPAVLNLSGSGVTAPPTTTGDLDIRKFWASKNLKLKGANGKNVKRYVRFHLMISNPGTVTGTFPATLVGVQNGDEIYRKTLNVSARPGKIANVLTFPQFVPTTLGDIAWTVTVADSDADVDQAVAVTTIRN